MEVHGRSILVALYAVSKALDDRAFAECIGADGEVRLVGETFLHPDTR
jgi:hypothetical protein